MRRQYPRYRNSGVEWLGPVPVHWEVKRLKNICNMQAGNGITAESIEPSGEYPVFGGNGLRGYTFQYTHEGNFILIGRQGALCGNVFIAKGRFWASEHAVITTLDSPHIIGWFAAALTAMNLNQYSVSAAQPGLSVERVVTLLIPLPPLDEQRVIAAFLDRETERIDKLVAKHRLLIERLAEYRTALITSTVTQGLPPDVARAAGFDPLPRFEPSGTEWLGDVPAHWDVLQLRHLGEAIIGLTYSPQDVVSEGRGVLVLRASNVVDDHIVYRDNVYVDCAVPERLIVRQGDILICSRSGSRALIGKNARIDAESAGATFGAFMTVFRGENSEYLHYVFNSKLFENQSGAYSTSTINQLTLEILNNIKVPWPPLAEQRAISAFLGRERARIDSLSGRVETAIERLQEYRTSLITAAITGKIDVREPVYEEAV